MKRLCLAIALTVAATAATAQKTHEIRPSPTTVQHGIFDASIKPALVIDSGDIVKLWTATGHPAYFQELGLPKEKIPQELFTAFEGVKGSARGDHSLVGPMYVNGAEIGDTIEVKIRRIELWLPIAAMSFRAGRGSIPEEFPYSRDKILWLDVPGKKADFAPGVVIPLTRPFWGDIGVAPPLSMGRINASIPGVHGGNMDNHDMLPGTSLFLPVHATGALLSIADGHASQGNGEVGQSAIETSLQGEIQVILHKGMTTRWPRAETPTHYMSIGLDPDLNVAAKMAIKEMLDFLTRTKGLSREDAYMLMSATMDLHVTQVVDVTKGVHAMIPKAIFTK
ncbi:MAG: Acetamidase [Betaproteobacteria bacterium]|jgi:acetamidase/formamidase|nr:Acetamidase [Betaproteobacteria bacterium]